MTFDLTHADIAESAMSKFCLVAPDQQIWVNEVEDIVL